VNEISFNPQGFAVLPVYIKPKHQQAMPYVRYKVDSGANKTTISRGELNKLGFNDAWISTGRHLENDERPTLASGFPVDDCYEVVLPEINIGDFVGYNWPFLTSLSVPFKFLLGTDTMQFFNWHFNYAHGLCQFTLIPGKRRILFNSLEQSIHSIDDLEQQ
jgi:hypothetical protein